MDIFFNWLMYNLSACWCTQMSVKVKKTQGMSRWRPQIYLGYNHLSLKDVEVYQAGSVQWKMPLICFMWDPVFFTAWTIKVTKTSLNLLLTLKISALPLPFSPKARAGGTVIFRFSPAHMSFIPMSRPLMICPTPCTNHWGWPSLSDRLKQKQKQTINHDSYQYWTVRLSSLEGGRWGIVTFTLASWDNCALFAIFSNRPTS